MSRPPHIERLVHSSLADAAHETIRKAIMGGVFPPGHQLVETAIAQDVGVSRATVREALRRLRDERLVVWSPNRGVFVRELTARDVVQLHNLRIGVEGVAIRLCARLGAPTDGLWRAVEEMHAFAAAQDIVGLSDRELAFHEELCRQSGNEYVDGTFHSIAGVLRVAFAGEAASYDDPQLVAEEHVPMIEAIEARDEARALTALIEHIDIKTSVTQAGLRVVDGEHTSIADLVSVGGIASWPTDEHPRTAADGRGRGATAQTT